MNTLKLNASRPLITSWSLAAMMVAAAFLCVVVAPTKKLADTRPQVDLAAIVPVMFGEWREDQRSAGAVVNPAQEAAIAKIYAQTLSRTYVNATGERIMLSIAYGSDQAGEGTQAHRPEICYSAQGFSVGDSEEGVLAAGTHQIPVRRLVAVSGARNEPITYWMTVGDRAALPGLSRKLVQLSYTFSGDVPDGVLFRVSSIQLDKAAAYTLQAAFVRDLFATLNPSKQARLAGNIDG